MSDETIMVAGNGTIFLGGPPLVKAATGEVVTSEELGGADVHCGISGVSDYYAKDEFEGLSMARDIISSLNQARISDDGRKTYQEPLFPCEELGGIIPTDSKQPFDVRKILARILDGSRFQEYKAKYGTTIVTGFGELYGNKVGIIANNGILFSESSLKAANFVGEFFLKIDIGYCKREEDHLTYTCFFFTRAMLPAGNSNCFLAKHYRIYGRQVHPDETHVSL